MRTGFPLLPWMLRLSLAEAAGIAVVAVAYAAADRGAIAPAAPFILAAGGWEGACLGLAQAGLLARRGVRVLPWLALTVAAAVAGYALSLPAAGAAETGGGAPPLWLIAAGGAGLGLGMGGLMGLVQSPALPATLGRGRWVLASMAGWAPAMAVIMLAASTVPAGLPLGAVALVGALSGAVAGAALAITTGWALRRGWQVRP